MMLSHDGCVTCLQQELFQFNQTVAYKSFYYMQVVALICIQMVKVEAGCLHGQCKVLRPVKQVERVGWLIKAGS